MTLDSLRDFVRALEDTGQLVRVREQVSVDREITEIADRCMKSTGGGPALLFEHPVLPDGAKSRFPVLINAFGSTRRMETALGASSLDDIGSRIQELLATAVPDGMAGKLSMLPKLAELATYPPARVREPAPCQSVVLREHEVDLRLFPHLICWPEDGGPYITFPMVITKDPVTGTRNVGLYRIQVQGPRELAMHWQRHKVGAAHWREMASRGEKMPVAIVLGADPASMYAASAPLPPTVDEFLFAGFLRRSPVRLVKCLTSDLEVPAEAEIVLEGYIDPAEDLVMEGPFGDHTGFYSLA
ncbi:MAG: UbiD family decarboxylase, partial [Gemmatimonadales bacterium]|nr:UbiD family decarboxylase [Gemmatimonadales bacterium]